MSEIFTLGGLMGLLSLTLMEIVLGIDNVIFISILTGRLPADQQNKARQIGLFLAMGVRIMLLFGISWLISFNKPLFTVFDFEATGRDLILFAGGMFLIYKSTAEIHAKIEGEHHDQASVKQLTFASAIFQIILLDIVFSFDSILTAIGLVDEVLIMVIAVVISLIIMMLASGAISRFINKHPTVKMLALSFLLLIGVLLTVEGFHAHVPKGYVYFAIFFSLLVEILNMKVRQKSVTEKIME